MMALVVRLGFKKKQHSFKFHLSSLTTGSFTGVIRFRTEGANNKIPSQLIDTEPLRLSLRQRPGKSPGLGKQRNKANRHDTPSQGSHESSVLPVLTKKAQIPRDLSSESSKKT